MIRAAFDKWRGGRKKQDQPVPKANDLGTGFLMACYDRRLQDMLALADTVPVIAYGEARRRLGEYIAHTGDCEAAKPLLEKFDIIKDGIVNASFVGALVTMGKPAGNGHATIDYLFDQGARFDKACFDRLHFAIESELLVRLIDKGGFDVAGEKGGAYLLHTGMYGQMDEFIPVFESLLKAGADPYKILANGPDDERYEGMYKTLVQLATREGAGGPYFAKVLHARADKKIKSLKS